MTEENLQEKEEPNHQGEDESEIDANIKDRALRMGWVDRPDFRGNPDKWIPANRYVERAETELPIALGTIKTLERKMVNMGEKIDRQTTAIKQFHAHHSTSLQKAAEENYQRGLEEARGRVRQAVEEGDVEAANTAFKDAEELLRHPPKPEEALPKEDDTPKVDEEVTQSWVKENDWYIKIPRMAKYAYECGEFLAKTKPQLTQSEQLKEIAAMAKEEFPNYFENPNRKKASTVDSADKVAGPGGNRGKKTYNDLPSDARTICDSLCAEIPGYSQKDYVNEYFGQFK